MGAAIPHLCKALQRGKHHLAPCCPVKSDAVNLNVTVSRPGLENKWEHLSFIRCKLFYDLWTSLMYSDTLQNFQLQPSQLLNPESPGHAVEFPHFDLLQEPKAAIGNISQGCQAATATGNWHQLAIFSQEWLLIFGPWVTWITQQKGSTSAEKSDPGSRALWSLTHLLAMHSPSQVQHSCGSRA